MEALEIEEWLDNNPEFVKDYFIKNASQSLVDLWMSGNSKRPTPATQVTSKQDDVKKWPGEPRNTVLRRISAHDLVTSTGMLQPMLRKDTTGQLTFVEAEAKKMSPVSRHASCIAEPSTTVRPSDRAERNEKELLWELVTDIFNDLDVDTVCLKILCNVNELVNADRCSLFLVHGEPGSPEHCLVSQLFDVNSSPKASLNIDRQKYPKVRIAWGAGIAGHVAKNGEAIVTDDAYQDNRFDRTVDERTGYVTRSVMCLPIKHSNGQILGVAQAINKRGNGQTFTKLDQKVKP